MLFYTPKSLERFVKCQILLREVHFNLLAILGNAEEKPITNVLRAYLHASLPNLEIVGRIRIDLGSGGTLTNA